MELLSGSTWHQEMFQSADKPHVVEKLSSRRINAMALVGCEFIKVGHCLVQQVLEGPSALGQLSLDVNG